MSTINNALYPKPAFVGGSSSTAVASQSTTVSTVAIAATGYTNEVNANTTSGVDFVTFDVQTSAVRVRWDGTDPTSTVGHYLPVQGAYTWTVSQYNSAKFIRDTAASADAVIFASPLCG